jgi:hypothetical protein
MLKRSVYSAWDGNPPSIQMIAMPMPDAPYLPLTGGGTARMSLQSFLKELESDYNSQRGYFFEYVWESDRDEADTYALENWEVCTPESGIYEAIVILYYSPINTYLTLRKHFGEDAAVEYLQSIAGVDQASVEGITKA